jgi:hypothetical protein
VAVDVSGSLDRQLHHTEILRGKGFLAAAFGPDGGHDERHVDAGCAERPLALAVSGGAATVVDTNYVELRSILRAASLT